MWCPKLHKGSVAFGACILGSTMMHSLFTFYYVKVFLNRYRISETWFQMSQVVFMIWNAINDPLFGYCQDHATMKCVRSRRHAILYSAPLFVMSFLVPWFQWHSYDKEWSWLGGVHLMVALCLYDAMYTFVGLARNSIFTEMSQKQEDRLRLVQYSQVASLVGSSMVLMCELLTNNLQNYQTFQVITIVVAVISYMCHRYTGLNAHTQYERDRYTGLNAHTQYERDPDSATTTDATACISPGTSPGTSPKQREIGETYNAKEELFFWKSFWQIVSQRNFLYFVSMNFFQEFHRTFSMNFVSIFVDNLISKEDVPLGMKSIFFGSLFILPQVIVMFATPLIAKVGYFEVIRSTFLIKMTLPIFMYILSTQRSYFLLAFLLMDSVLVNAVYNLFPLALSDIADEDMKRHSRSHPISAMIFGLNALVIKPAISLAPMGVVAMLNDFGYEQYKKHKLTSRQEVEALHGVMFYLICGVPVVLGIIQIVLWSQYNIRNSHIDLESVAEASVDL